MKFKAKLKKQTSGTFFINIPKNVIETMNKHVDDELEVVLLDIDEFKNASSSTKINMLIKDLEYNIEKIKDLDGETEESEIQDFKCMKCSYYFSQEMLDEQYCPACNCLDVELLEEAK